MTHLAFDVVTAFMATPLTRSEERSNPSGGGGLPIVFILFSVVCAALSVVEAWRAPSLVLAPTVEQALAPRL